MTFHMKCYNCNGSKYVRLKNRNPEYIQQFFSKRFITKFKISGDLHSHIQFTRVGYATCDKRGKKS